MATRDSSEIPATVPFPASPKAALWREFLRFRTGWNQEAVDILPSNETCTGQKTVSAGAVQIEKDGPMDRYLYTAAHVAIFSGEVFMEAQEGTHRRPKIPERSFTIKPTFCDFA